MIPLLGNDIRTLLGKLGAWPCDFSQDTAVALYDVAVKNLPSNGIAVDLTPSAGKSTVVLSAAAFRVGAKTAALLDKASMHPAEEMWFNRAYRTFKMKDTCTAAEQITNMNADMIVVRGNPMMARSVYAEGLKPEGILFGINLPALDGLQAEQAGPSWAVWRKPKAAANNPFIDKEKYLRDAAVLSVPDKPERTSAQEFRDNVAMYSPSTTEVAEAIITEEEARALREAHKI